MELLKKKFQIVFVLMLSLFFVNCSSNSLIDDKEGEGGKGKGSHSYDITFTKGGDVINYKGTISPNATSQEFVSMYIEDTEDFPVGSKVITYIIYHEGVNIITMLSLKSNGIPYPFSKEAAEEGLGSGMTVTDDKSSPMIVSKSGTGVLKNLKTVKSPDPKIFFASFTHEFEGQFDVLRPGEDKPTVYSGKGKIVINPYIY